MQLTHGLFEKRQLFPNSQFETRHVDRFSIDFRRRDFDRFSGKFVSTYENFCFVKKRNNQEALLCENEDLRRCSSKFGSLGRVSIDVRLMFHKFSIDVR